LLVNYLPEFKKDPLPDPPKGGRNHSFSPLLCFAEATRKRGGKMKGGFSIRKSAGFISTIIRYYLAFGTEVKRYYRFSYLYTN